MIDLIDGLRHADTWSDSDTSCSGDMLELSEADPAEAASWVVERNAMLSLAWKSATQRSGPSIHNLEADDEMTSGSSSMSESDSAKVQSAG